MTLKIGTDCSGIEAPIQALHKLNIKYEHKFSSEIDKYAKETLKANYNPEILYDDMTKPRKLPPLDIYVCGFPCQPFSMAGRRLGAFDKRSIFEHCIHTIKQTKPTIFILENVKGITTVNEGEYWNYILKYIGSLKKDYEINIDLYNTKDYGIPQNRERIYFVGLLKKKLFKSFEKPKHKKLKPLEEFVDKKDTHKEDICENLIIPINKSSCIFCDICFVKISYKSLTKKYCSTLMANSSIWCKPMHRRANVKELLKLQGFPTSFKQVVSNTQMKKQIGNSMSVNVLVEIFKECFRCVNI